LDFRPVVHLQLHANADPGHLVFILRLGDATAAPRLQFWPCLDLFPHLGKHRISTWVIEMETAKVNGVSTLPTGQLVHKAFNRKNVCSGAKATQRRPLIWKD
jgi:hypothetical protein